MSAPNEIDVIPESELIELFEPRRPDPGQFREGVERRIEKLRAENEKAGAAPVSPWLRRVASFLPADLLVGSASGAAFGKLTAAKLLPAVLSLPVIFLGSALGAFAAGARSMKRSVASAAPAEPNRQWSLEGPQENQDLRKGAKLQRWIGYACFVGLVGAPWFSSTDVMLVCVLISMAALTISMRGFAGAGLMTRPQVGRLCAGVLLTASISFYFGSGPHAHDDSSEIGTGWSAGILIAGSVLCFLFSPGTRYQPNKLWRIALLGLFLFPSGWTRSSRASLSTQLEAMELNPGELRWWEEAAALHRALALTGGPLPDMSAVKLRIDEAIDAGIDEHPDVWVAALQMGLIDEPHRARLSEIPSVRDEIHGVLTGAHPLNYLAFDSYLVDMLRDEAKKDSVMRDKLVDQLEALWPKDDDHGALKDAWLCVRALDEIGAKERADALSDKAHALLVSHWVADAHVFGERGGFTSNPVKFGTSFLGDTWCGVQLMERFGAPPEIDLRQLRGYLRSKSGVLLWDIGARLCAEPRASLRVLEDCIGLPRRNLFQRCLDERLLLASLLLVSLCLMAIRSAPSPQFRETKGALP